VVGNIYKDRGFGFNMINEMIGKVKFYMDKRIAVHIMCADGKFYNGFVLEIVGEDFLVLVDRVLGETPVYFSQIKSVERFLEKEK